MRMALRSREGSAPVSCQTTTTEAKISISESRPNPASATDRAARAASATTTVPTTFQPSVTYSRRSPRRRSALPSMRVRIGGGAGWVLPQAPSTGAMAA
jgi:hypothetical protein